MNVIDLFEEEKLCKPTLFFALQFNRIMLLNCTFYVPHMSTNT